MLTNKKAEDLTGPVRSVQTKKAIIVRTESSYVEGPLILQNRSVYDIHGMKAEDLLFSEAGLLRVRVAFVHNGSGYLTEAAEYSPDGELLRKKTTAGEKPGEGVEETIVKGEQLQSKTITSLNDQSNPVERVAYNSHGDLLERSVYKYDTQGRVSEIVV